MIVMSELIYELSDSELDAIAGGQTVVGGNFIVTATTNAAAGAAVVNSVNSTANASATANTGITIT
jgi:hypothetical protein